MGAYGLMIKRKGVVGAPEEISISQTERKADRERGRGRGREQEKTGRIERPDEKKR